MPPFLDAADTINNDIQTLFREETYAACLNDGAYIACNERERENDHNVLTRRLANTIQHLKLHDVMQRKIYNMTSIGYAWKERYKE